MDNGSAQANGRLRVEQSLRRRALSTGRCADGPVRPVFVDSLAVFASY